MTPVCRRLGNATFPVLMAFKETAMPGNYAEAGGRANT